MQRDNVGQVRSPLIYYLNNELSQDTEVDHLVQLRVDSESFITKHTLGQRTRHTRSSGASSERLNQIALLAMLATKGSVTVCMGVSMDTTSSNLIQCSHSLGQQFRWFRCTDETTCVRLWVILIQTRTTTCWSVLVCPSVITTEYSPMTRNVWTKTNQSMLRPPIRRRCNILWQSCVASRGLLWDECFIEGLTPIAFFVHAHSLLLGQTTTCDS